MSRSTHRCKRCGHELVEVRSTAIGERRCTFLGADVVVRTLATPKRLVVSCGNCGTPWVMQRARLVVFLEPEPDGGEAQEMTA